MKMIYKGVRYEEVYPDGDEPCDECELKDKCEHGEVFCPVDTWPNHTGTTEEVWRKSADQTNIGKDGMEG